MFAQFTTCQRCGDCCRIEGQVRLTETDITRLAGFLGLGETVFIERFTRLAADRRGLALLENASCACVFLEGNECRVQPAKPAQCAAFPVGWRNPGWETICRGAASQ